METISGKNLVGTERLTSKDAEGLRIVGCNLAANRPLTPLVCECAVEFIRCNLANRLLVDTEGKPLKEPKLTRCQTAQVLCEAAVEQLEAKGGPTLVGTGVEATATDEVTIAHRIGTGVTGEVVEGPFVAARDAAAAVTEAATALAITRIAP